jgi:hypothetical protein
MNKKISIIVVSFLVLISLFGCYDTNDSNENLAGEAMRYVFGNLQIKPLQKLLIKKEPLERIEVKFPDGQNCKNNTNCLSDFCLPAEKKCAPIEVAYYLNDGMQTVPGHFVNQNLGNINTNFNNHYGNIVSISNWIHSNIICHECDRRSTSLVGSNTAEELLSSINSVPISCTDFGIVFVTLARAKGYPTKFVDTYGLDYLKKLDLGNCNINVTGHIYTNIYLDGEWHVYDPVAMRFFEPVFSDNCIDGCYWGGDGGKELYVVTNKGLDLWDLGFNNRHEANENIREQYFC